MSKCTSGSDIAQVAPAAAFGAQGFHVVIASAAKQSRLSPREDSWIASLRSQ
ncbi:hypothetical protein [Bradyrhizobium centrolobii]|uniref:hypothetical protein n=1 Tax=Bradyrhizobium centrolobii TaxID=1505087 RepID=UPI00137474B1|nr:hypothetical protein [Bradyrhizobium centrolobii]